MSEINFLKEYFNSLKSLIDNEKYFNDLIKVKDILKKTQQLRLMLLVFLV